MSASPRSTADVPTRATEARLLVAVGLAGGGQLRGWLNMRGVGRVLDVLNNWVDPFITLAASDAAATSGTIVIVRRELVWMAALNSEPVRYQPVQAATAGGGTLPRPHAIIMHLGPYEVRGLANVYPGTNWQDYLSANSRPASFLPITEARITGPAGTLDAALVAVSAARVEALLGLG